jgi:pimeloyl-ACP methyl ester carboxylesterase
VGVKNLTRAEIDSTMPDSSHGESSGTASKTAVVFVHGFACDEKCWAPLKKLCEEDVSFRRNSYSFHCFRYETKWFNWKPWQRIPRLQELGDGLRTFLDNRFKGWQDWILVGYSQGGLVIQSYLQRRIGVHCGTDLAKIRAVILFATPNLGSDRKTPSQKLTSDALLQANIDV